MWLFNDNFVYVSYDPENRLFAVLGGNDDELYKTLPYPFDIRTDVGKYMFISRSYDDVYLIPVSKTSQYIASSIACRIILSRDDYDNMKKFPGTPLVELNHEDEVLIIKFPQYIGLEADSEISYMISKGRLYRRVEDKVSSVFDADWKMTSFEEEEHFILDEFAKAITNIFKEN